MEKKYIAPSVTEIIPIGANNLMETISLGIGTTPAPGGGDAKKMDGFDFSWDEEEIE